MFSAAKRHLGLAMEIARVTFHASRGETRRE